MLNAKHGVITEERFQKLTKAQWLFHYQEVIRERQRQSEDKADAIISVLKLFDNRVELLLETISEGCKLAGAMSNPEAGKALLEAEKLKELKADIGDEEFSDFWEEFSERIPSALVVEDVGEHVGLEGDCIDLEKLYEADMAHRKKVMKEMMEKEAQEKAEQSEETK